MDSASVPGFYRDLNDSDSGIRYWATVGCFNLQNTVKLDMSIIRKLLIDDSHHVRAMAAWILYRDGDNASAEACWNDLLSKSSYASLKVFNIIDWIGDGTEPYADAMRACKLSHGGYVARMQQYLGVEPPSEKRQK